MRGRRTKKNFRIAGIIAVIVILLAAIGFAFIPSIAQSLTNGKKSDCSHDAYVLLNKLDEVLNGTEENKIWYDIITEKNSDRLLQALNRELGNEKIPNISDYYIKFGDTNVSILCRKHTELSDISLIIPDNVISYDKPYNMPKSDIMTHIAAHGRDMYFKNSRLDKNDQSKTFFTNNDDTSSLFPDITVTAYFLGGGTRTLRPDEYKIYVGELDMTKTGKKALRVMYTGQTWPDNLQTSFEIEIMDSDAREPLIVDAGNFGKYELASWVWTDYVADALDSPVNYLDFGASIVFDEGEYYYYPDGFTIVKDNKDNGSIKGAMDTDDHEKEAYKIKFDTKTRVATTSVSQGTAHEGSLKFENDTVYIWQSQSSKELGRGWIKVYCDMKKVE